MVHLPRPLLRGRLLRRYKRFLVDVRLADGRQITAHCADPGRMGELAEPGRAVVVSESNDARRRLAYSWELVRLPRTWVTVRPARMSAVAGDALERATLAELADYSRRRGEVRSGGCRFDWMLEGDAGRCWLEVKCVTLAADGIAAFPDAVTARGRRQLDELAVRRRSGDRAVVLFLVGREDCAAFRVASWIDPEYASALDRAVADGVEVVVYDTRVRLAGIELARRLPWRRRAGPVRHL